MLSTCFKHPVIMALVAIIVAGCSVGKATVPETAEQDTTPLPVEISIPQRADIHASYPTTATIYADSEAPVQARVGGEVTDILVEEGDRVEAGQILARLDGERLRLEMLRATAELEKTRNEYERYLSLRERGLVSAAAVDDLRYKVDALKASFELKRLNYRYSDIRAPIAGTISLRAVGLGQHVQTGDETFRITDTTRLVAYLKIPQTELAKFAPGQEAFVKVDSVPDQGFLAAIARISPTIDTRSGTIKATVYIDNANGVLAPGMFGRFEIIYDKHENALLIPASAAIQEDSETVIFVAHENSVERRVVQTGIRSKDQVEILAGLYADERIVKTGLSGLRDGSRIVLSANTDAISSGG